jgi:hypothetical protein
MKMGNIGDKVSFTPWDLWKGKNPSSVCMRAIIQQPDICETFVDRNMNSFPLMLRSVPTLALYASAGENLYDYLRGCLISLFF